MTAVDQTAMINTFGDQLAGRLAAWRSEDPDPATQLALDGLITRAMDGDRAALAELANAFDGRLAFGTAGLRGELGPGPNRMNRVVVAQAAAGLAGYLLDRGHAGGTVIIGFDARYNSDVFARDTAEILAGAGFSPLLTDRPTPTPVVAFGIRHHGCVAGVVVTASHNPPQDNGYKVYLGDGSQIVPPTDGEIAERIDEVAGRPVGDIPRSQQISTLGAELLEAYLDRSATLVPVDAARELRWVYTPLHGVGAASVEGALRRTGFPEPFVVTEQEAPDPAFPTVAFPNPEEPGAIDLALAAAVEHDAELVIANDPDADRCAVAVPVSGVPRSSGAATGAPADRSWRMLTGDELGVIIAEDFLRRGVGGVYACSIVSSSQLARMAAAHDQQFRYTLTGFKWIGRVPNLAFGYEEAIGYCCDPAAVPDKDGITTLITVLRIAAELRAAGSSLAERLTEIHRRYGVHLTAPLSIRVTDLSVITEAMTRLRADPPTTLLGDPVRVIDLNADSAAQGGPELPTTDGLLIIGDRLKVVVRPSGTEPKLKCYLEVHAEPGRDLDHDRAHAERQLTALREEMSGLLGF